MIATDVAEMIDARRVLNADTVAQYSGCTHEAASRCLQMLYQRGALRRVRRGVYTVVAGARLRRQTRYDQVLQALPGTMPQLVQRVGSDRSAVQSVIGRLRRMGHAITCDKEGVYDLC